ncbi:MAG: DUF86 domain-containing protein [Paramuribaculum sp.]|nr:DUF86 domain-containing protein [Paramuribaculum sp.]
MRESDRDLTRLHHIQASIRNVMNFMAGRTEEDLTTDAMLFFAVVKNIEIIGEAAYKLTDQFKDNHPLTPWRPIIKMRHILTHGYYQVSADEIYSVYKKDLNDLSIQIEQYIDELTGGN